MEKVANRAEWFCLRAFRFEGKDYQIGDAFPWRQNGCTERRLEQMISGRRIGRREDLPKAAPKEPAKK